MEGRTPNGPPPPGKDPGDDPDNESNEDGEDVPIVFTTEPEQFIDILSPPPPPEPEAPTQLLTGDGYTVAYTGPIADQQVARTVGVAVADVEQPVFATFEDGVLVAFGNSDKGDLAVEGFSDQWYGWARWYNDSGFVEAQGVPGQTFTFKGDSQTFFYQDQSVYLGVGRGTQDLTQSGPAAMGRAEAFLPWDAANTPVATDDFGNQYAVTDARFGIDFVDVEVSGSVDVNNQMRLAFADFPVVNGGFGGPNPGGQLQVVGLNGFSCCSGCTGWASGLVAGEEAQRAVFTFHTDEFGNHIYGLAPFNADLPGPGLVPHPPGFGGPVK